MFNQVDNSKFHSDDKKINTNGGRGILASTPHIVLCNTMWGVDAKNPPPSLVLHNTIGGRGILACTTYMVLQILVIPLPLYTQR